MQKLQLILKDLPHKIKQGNKKEKLIAYERAQCILNHLHQDNHELALVPLPGTFQHGEWQKALGKSKFFKVLSDWKQNFLFGKKELADGLRRIRIIENHLRPVSVQSDTLFLE